MSSSAHVQINDCVNSYYNIQINNILEISEAGVNEITRQSKTVIEDNKGYINNIKQRQKSEPSFEHAGVAIAEYKARNKFVISDYAAADVIGIKQNIDSVLIPRKLCLSIILVCKKHGFSPVIIHSHVSANRENNYISFSLEDKDFIANFAKVAKYHKLASPLFFFLTDGVNDTSIMVL